MKEMDKSRKSRSKRFLKFEKNDKIRLIAAVRARRLLWDTTEKVLSDVFSVNSLKEAWEAVGAELGREPNDCKVAWRSLRQSYRYHCKAAKKNLSMVENDDEGEVDPLETPDIQWAFANHMTFLKEMTEKKRSNSVTIDETTTNNAALEDYTDMEYLDMDDQDSVGDDVDYQAAENDDEYLTKSSKDKDMKSQPKIAIDILCRTCTQPTDARVSENLFKPHNHQLLKSIKVLTDLNLKQDEDYSDFICQHCQQILEIATEFRRVCIEAQSHLLINDQSQLLKQEQPEEMDSPVNLEEEILEAANNSDNENYSEEVEVQPLTSKSKSNSPTGRKRLKKQPKILKQCHECGLTFASYDLLKMHMHETHDMQLQTRFVCKHCGHDFQYSEPLVEHLKSIGVHFGHKCEECDQSFHSRHFLKKHKRRIHGLADKHICHICGKNFSTGFNLRNHIVRHGGTRPHKCKSCSAAFATTAELTNHKRIHDNIRPYPCRYGCGKAFRHCSNRSTHERVHMDGSLRPFQCEYCDKTFVTIGDCRAHQAVHTMSRDFSCDICEQSFKLHKHYLQHILTRTHKKMEALALENTEAVAKI